MDLTFPSGVEKKISVMIIFFEMLKWVWAKIAQRGLIDLTPELDAKAA